MLNFLIQKAYAQEFPAVPIPNWSNIATWQGIMSAIVNTLIFAASIVAVIAIIFGGYQYVTSAGNPEKAAQAKNTLLYAIIGLIVVYSAYLIIRVFAGAIGY